MPPCVRVARSSNHESRITNHGRSGPPLCGGTPPATPPVAMPPCVRVARSSNHESRITAVPALPYAGDTPCNAPCSYATVRARRPQFESRITNHESRITAVPALPCAGGHPPQRPPVAMPPCVRVARSSNCESRITNHESRITAVPAVPSPGQNESCPLMRPPRQFVSTVLDFASPCASDPRRCPRERSPAGPRRTACRRSSTCCWTRHRGSHS